MRTKRIFFVTMLLIAISMVCGIVSCNHPTTENFDTESNHVTQTDVPTEHCSDSELMESFDVPTEPVEIPTVVVTDAPEDLTEVPTDDFMDTTEIAAEESIETETETPEEASSDEPIIVESIIALTREGFDQEYTEGELFDTESIDVWGRTSRGDILITDFSVEDKILTVSDSEIYITYLDHVTVFPIVVKRKTLENIEIIMPPVKTVYLDGESFDGNGMTVRALFSNQSSCVVYDYEMIDADNLSVDVNEVTIRYTYEGLTSYVTQAITVMPKKLLSICVDPLSQVRTIYTQGDRFDPTGLIVKARYENFGETEISGYKVLSDILTSKDSTVEISYSEGGLIQSVRLPVTVLDPYEKTVRIKVTNPTDISLSWMYSYMSHNGDLRVDNTAHEEHGLVYDTQQGVYEVPVGAVITATIMNPAVLNIALNGVEQHVNYSDKALTWVVDQTNDMTLDTYAKEGNYSVIRFYGREAEISFLYGTQWDGALPIDTISQLQKMYPDGDNWYYTYCVNGEIFGCDELSELNFKTTSEVTVVKNAVATNAKEMVLHVDGLDYSFKVSPYFSFEELPVFRKEGYIFEGWTTYEDGEILNDQNFKMMLAGEQNTIDLYAKWRAEIVNYPGGAHGGEDVGVMEKPTETTGVWESVWSNSSKVLKAKLELNSDGTYNYQVSVNGTTNCLYTGMYRLRDDGSLTILTIDTADMNIPAVSLEEFAVSYIDGYIWASVIIHEDMSISIFQSRFDRVPM